MSDDEYEADRLEAMFDECDDEYLHFERIADPASPRPEVCAFLLLDALAPPPRYPGGGVKRMIEGAEHDIIYLAVDMEALNAVATIEHVRTLRRCGVHFDTESDSLAMFR